MPLPRGFQDASECPTPATPLSYVQNPFEKPTGCDCGSVAEIEIPPGSVIDVLRGAAGADISTGDPFTLPNRYPMAKIADDVIVSNAMQITALLVFISFPPACELYGT
jgi:hypothetical protein